MIKRFNLLLFWPHNSLAYSYFQRNNKRLNKRNIYLNYLSFFYYNKMLTKRKQIDQKVKEYLIVLVQMPYLKFILLFFLITLFFGVITFFLPSHLASENPVNHFDSITEQLLFGVLIGPIIETLLFQSLIISIICKIVKKTRFNLIPALVISAIAFGLNHSYNLVYIIYTFIIGIFLAFVYYVARFRKESATLSVFLIHSIINLISFNIDSF